MKSVRPGIAGESARTPSSRTRGSGCLLLLSGLLLSYAFNSEARINLVTLPKRDSVQLTIYNSVDLTLVRERRSLTFRKGMNRLEFSWANTLIDPTSVEFRAITHSDQIEVLDVSFPPRVSNTLEWRIQSEFAGEAQVEIRYFTSGINWSADYVAEAEKNENQMRLSGFVKVNNQSGEDYDNAEVRLVVGVIRLVEEIAQLARQRAANDGRLANAPMTEVIRDDAKAVKMYSSLNGVEEKAEAGARRKEVVKEAMSEYFLYTVEGRESIPHGWARRMPSFQTSGIPLISYYKYEKERWGEQVVRYCKFTNSIPNRLGKEPLPDGEVKAFRLINPDELYAFVGRTRVKYIPVNEAVEMELGNDLEVSIKPVLIDWQKLDIKFNGSGNIVGWTTREQWKIELQNSKEIPMEADIRRNFSGDWTVTTQNAYEKVDANKIKFVIPLKSREEKTLIYEVTTRHGTNATR